MFVPRVDNRRYFVPLLLALIAIAWLALFAWGESPYGRFLSHDQLGDISIGLSAEGVGIALVFVAGWTVMTFAMMLPTSLPLITMFEKIVRRRTETGHCFVLLLGGLHRDMDGVRRRGAHGRPGDTRGGQRVPLAGGQLLPHRRRDAGPGRRLPVHAVEVHVPGQMPFSAELHH